MRKPRRRSATSGGCGVAPRPCSSSARRTTHRNRLERTHAHAGRQERAGERHQRDHSGTHDRSRDRGGREITAAEQREFHHGRPAAELTGGEDHQRGRSTTRAGQRRGELALARFDQSDQQQPQSAGHRCSTEQIQSSARNHRRFDGTPPRGDGDTDPERGEQPVGRAPQPREIERAGQQRAERNAEAHAGAPPTGCRRASAGAAVHRGDQTQSGRDHSGRADTFDEAPDDEVRERWTLLVLRDCFYGVRRFTDLREHLDISRAVLADRLDTLVEAGVLTREEKSGGHPEYLLTEAGRALWPTIFALSKWGEQHTSGPHPSRLFSHAACDTDIDDLGRCPTCGRTPRPRRPRRPTGPRNRRDAPHRPRRPSPGAPHRMLTPIDPPAG